VPLTPVAGHDEKVDLKPASNLGDRELDRALELLRVFAGKWCGLVAVESALAGLSATRWGAQERSRELFRRKR
jgi:hypothetical protein